MKRVKFLVLIVVVFMFFGCRSRSVRMEEAIQKRHPSWTKEEVKMSRVLRRVQTTRGQKAKDKIMDEEYPNWREKAKKYKESAEDRRKRLFENRYKKGE